MSGLRADLQQRTVLNKKGASLLSAEMNIKIG